MRVLAARWAWCRCWLGGGYARVSPTIALLHAHLPTVPERDTCRRKPVRRLSTAYEIWLQTVFGESSLRSQALFAKSAWGSKISSFLLSVKPSPPKMATSTTGW